MKTVRLILALFGLFIMLKTGEYTVIPGNNVVIFEDVKVGEKTVTMGIINDAQGKELGRIPADLIVGIGAINENKPDVEL